MEGLTSMTALFLFLGVPDGVRLLVDAEGYVELVLRADNGGVGLVGSVTCTTGTLRMLVASGSGGTCSCGTLSG